MPKTVLRGPHASSSLRRRQARQFFKTEMCKFYMQGHCDSGGICPYAHDQSELRSKPDLEKTSICINVIKFGMCTDELCRFAHKEEELRATHGFFKMKMCNFVASGRCKQGSACRFAHSRDELRNPNQQQRQQQQQQRQQQQLQQQQQTVFGVAPTAEAMAAVEASGGELLASPQDLVLPYDAQGAMCEEPRTQRSMPTFAPLWGEGMAPHCDDGFLDSPSCFVESPWSRSNTISSTELPTSSGESVASADSCFGAFPPWTDLDTAVPPKSQTAGRLSGQQAHSPGDGMTRLETAGQYFDLPKTSTGPSDIAQGVGQYDPDQFGGQAIPICLPLFPVASMPWAGVSQEVPWAGSAEGMGYVVLMPQGSHGEDAVGADFRTYHYWPQETSEHGAANMRESFPQSKSPCSTPR